MTPEERILKIERRCKLLTVALFAMLITAAVSIFAGATAPETLQEMRVSRLEVVDQEGKVRVVLGDLHKGVFGATVYAANGDPRAHLIDLGQLKLTNTHSDVILMASEKSGSIHVNAAGQRPRAMLYARDDHSGLQLRDANGAVAHQFESPRIQLPINRKANDPFGE